MKVSFNLGGGTITAPKHRVPTFDEWELKGIELFGSDRRKWRFHCPSCHNEISAEEALAEYGDALKGSDWRPESGCVFRSMKPDKCNWVAWGLFSAPVWVEKDGKHIAVFDFAGLPYTKEDLS